MTTPTIRWTAAFKSPPERIYEALTTDGGRRSFWASETEERDGVIYFRYPNGWLEASRIVAAEPPHRFEIIYFGAPTRFGIERDGEGAVLTVTAENVPEGEWNDVHAGWVAVLLGLKAYADFGIDLRNGDPARSWDAGFVDQ